MAGDADWQNHVDSVQRGSVSANVNARRAGPVVEPELGDSADGSEDAPSENQQARSEGYEDKWEKRFDHLPGVPHPNRK